MAQQIPGHDWDYVPNVSRNKILTEIRSCLDQVQNWRDSPQDSFEYYIEAKTLIELLEAEDCGSTGGFGHRISLKKKVQEVEHQEKIPEYRHTLEGRYRWLAEMASPSRMRSRL
jgi:hypothetical protein